MLSSPIQDSPRSFRVETPQDINWNEKFLMKIVQIIVFERVSSDHGISFKWLCSISFLPKANEISSDCYHQSHYSHDALSFCAQWHHSKATPISSSVRAHTAQTKPQSPSCQFHGEGHVQVDLFQGAFTSTEPPTSTSPVVQEIPPRHQ